MSKNFLITPLMVFLAAGGGVNAQDVSTAVMSGRVTSRDGAPLQGVRVRIESRALLGPRNAVTDSNGQFRTPLLPGGEYSVTYVLDGYITRKITTRLVAGQVGNASARLTKIGVQAETVDITTVTHSQQVDKTDTVVQTVLTSDLMAPLINSDDWVAMKNFIPGLQQRGGSTGEMLEGETTIRGGQFRSTKVLINGLNNTDMYGGYTHSRSGSVMPMQDLIESVAVMQSPLNARHGNSDGGLMSVVTSRGSNDFKGSYRMRLSNSMWGARDAGYPYRGINPRPLGTVTAPDDTINKTIEASLQGPIWKDHLTFAYGGVLTPTAYTVTNRWGAWSNPTPRPENSVGVYFQDPDTGDIIRRSELYSLTYPNSDSSRWYTKDYTERNQFTVFAQITPNHQLEYNYNESLRKWDNRPSTPPLVDMDPENINTTTKRNWSMAYKGIIGGFGVLDVSYGKMFTSEDDGKNGGKPLYLYQVQTYVPIDGNYLNYDPSNYWTNGYIDNQANPTRGGYNSFSIDYNGADIMASGGNEAFSFNYQHILSTSMGTHIFDVGMSNNKTSRSPNADSGFTAAPYVFYNTGQIAYDLGANPWDVYNPSDPNAISRAGNYAGKFIVFNPNITTARLLDPVGTDLWPGTILYPDAPLRQYGYASTIWPRMRKRFGNESGEFGVTMLSYYINDLWSINNNHSIMLGVRFDNFKLWDATNDSIHTYMKPTFRSEYKWDILGDQSRLLSVSLAQFHNQNQISAFQATVNSQRLANYKDYYWTGAALANARQDGRPYLVNKEDVLNEANYTDMYNETYGGQSGARLDPNFVAPTATELAITFSRNFRNGGSFKATYVYRTWSDLFDILPDAEGTANNFVDGQKQFVRVLKNTNEFEKTYKALELEWYLPLTKRFVFGGNYTYARLMHNLNGYSSGRNEARGVANWNNNVNLYEWWDRFWTREEWAPIYNQGPEHDIGFYVTYDLSAGKSRSSIALRGNYTAGDTAMDSWTWYVGRPNASAPGFEWLSGLQNWNYDSTSTAGINATTRSIPFNWRVNDDTWELRLRYHFEMPLVRKLTWFVTMDMLNPFNHRGISGWGAPTGETQPFSGGNNYNFKVDMYRNGTVLYPATDPWKGVWTHQSNLESYYRGRQSSRYFSMQTGIKF